MLIKEEWLAISGVLSSNNIAFQLPPTIKEEGSDMESGKYIVKDPAGNILEFKYYISFATTVEGKNA